MVSKTLDDITLLKFQRLIEQMFNQEERDIIEYWFQSIAD